jgi:hypothetical protein
MSNESNDLFPAGKMNYMILGAGAITVLLGFFLMSGGGSAIPSEFNGDELFSFRRITLAPFVVLLGFAVVAVGILRKPKS